MSIFFSVLVPVYNVEKYIVECIESVLRQQYSHFELILVDDGSTDSSGAICDEYAAKDSRIRVFHKQNQGLIHTRRTGIAKARGDYYVFLDSDDMLTDNALQTIADIISKYDCDCVIYGYEMVENGTVISKTEDTEEVYLTEKKEIYKKCFFSMEMNSLCRKAVRAAVFQNIDYSPYYHIQMSEDLLQSLEIYKYSRSFYFTSQILYKYRVNPSSITHERKEINIDYTVRKKALEHLQEEGVFSEELMNQYRDFCIIRVMNQIIKICLFSDKENTKKALKAIRQDDYFRSFLGKGITSPGYVGYQTILYWFFKRGYDNALIHLIRIAYKGKQCVNRIIR